MSDKEISLEDLDVADLEKLRSLARQRGIKARNEVDSSIPRVPRDQPLPLSPAQRRLWFLAQVEGASATYHMPAAMRLRGELDVSALRNTLHTILARHEALRSSFIVVDDEPQVALLPESCPFPMREHDLRGHLDAMGALSELRNEEALAHFDLTQGPLIRARLIRMADADHVLLITQHHIASDGWSLGILVNEFAALYAAFRQGAANPLPPLAVQYPDYAAWQRRWLTDERIAAQLDYWHRTLAGAPPLLQLPTDRPRSAARSHAGDGVPIRMDAGLSGALRSLCREHDVTMFTVVLTAWAVLLARLSGQDDVVIGTPSANRGRREIEPLVGFFVNTLALRLDLSEDLSITGLLARVAAASLAAQDRQDVSLDQIVERVNPPRRAEYAPLFQVVFTWRNQRDTPVDLHDIQVEMVPAVYNTTKFDIELVVGEVDGQLRGTLLYATALFDKATIERLGRRLEYVLRQIVDTPHMTIDELRVDPFAALPPVVPAEPEKHEPEPLSWHQERIWFIDTFERGYLYEESPVYHNIPLILKIKGPISAPSMNEALNDVVRRHDVLKTRVHVDGARASQTYSSEPLRLSTGSSAAEDALAHAIDESQRSFAMDENQPLIRAKLIRIDDDRSVLCITAHHLIADRESMRLLGAELIEIYQARTANRPPRIPDVPIQYHDYARWQRNLPPADADTLLTYWKYELRGKLQPMELPLSRPRAAVHVFEAGRHSFALDQALACKLDEVAGRYGTTIANVLLAGFHALLRRYTGHEELVMGTSVSCRNQPVLAATVGPIANLVVSRQFVDESTTFDLLLKQIEAKMARALHHRDMQFDQLVLALAPEKDMSRTALFDVLFQYDESPSTIPTGDGLEVAVVETNLGYGKNDLHLLIHAGDHGLEGKMVYNKLMLDPTLVEQMMAHYRVLLEALVADTATTLDAVRLLDDEAEDLQVNLWNASAAVYPADLTVHQIFEARVLSSPDRIAVSCGGDCLTYRELNDAANRLAHRLRADGIGPDDLVALAMDRSPWLFVAILGVMKSGGAYVPIDPTLPDERVSYIVRDCGARHVVTTMKASALLPAFDMPAVVLDGEGAILDEYPTHNPENINTPDDLIYVIYTSGSTGLPKGSLIEHRNVIRLLINDRLDFDFNENDVWSMFHSYAFDFSVWEMYGALLYGGRVVLVPDEARTDPASLLSFIAREHVSVLSQTPSVFYNLSAVATSGTGTSLPSLRYVVFGGEGLDPVKLEAFHRAYAHVDLINMYGITETCVHVTFKKIDDSDIASNLSNVGRPIPTTTVYVMDASQRLLPVGVPGEICVGGLGVGRGYLNRAELMAQRFIENPYRSGERLYRSGDLGKLLPNGELVHLGRMDHQVKLRGFRIELGEIEARLGEHPGVRDGVVLAVGEETTRRLVAYVVPRQGDAGDELMAEVRTHLAGCLPDYMVPAAFVRLGALPLTPNGKLDRRALPDPGDDAFALRAYAPPLGEVETALAVLWTDLLSLERVGRHDHFFELGGHSLLAVRLLSRVAQAFDVALPLAELFTHPTLEGLAAAIVRRQAEAGDTRDPILPVARDGHLPLSFAQQRLWFIA
ncbi:MAG: amino acid adenylation domain-containing protein, partial [Luteibacter sp.]